MEKKKVLVCDDSRLMLSILRQAFSKIEHIDIIFEAKDGREILNYLYNDSNIKPDVIILDIEMPIMSAVDFIEEYRETDIQPIPIILMSGYNSRSSAQVMKCIEMGVLDFVPKPNVGTNETLDTMMASFLSIIDGGAVSGESRAWSSSFLSEAGEEAQQASDDLPSPLFPKKVAKKASFDGDIEFFTSKYSVEKLKEKKKLTSKIDAIAIGISTGGPGSLRDIIAELDPSIIKVPIFLVQHMPKIFIESYVESLGSLSRLPIKEAEENEEPVGGVIYVSPGESHLEIIKQTRTPRIKINKSSLPVNGHKPSVGVLFKSIAEVYGKSSLSIIMTGMGNDGSLEIKELKDAGGLTIAQDAASSIVFGMPKVAIDNGAVDQVVPLRLIPKAINAIAAEYSW